MPALWSMDGVKNMAKKAYSYKDEDGLMGIVWAENSNQAKVEVQAESYMDYIDIRVQREPWADKYSAMEEIPPEEFWAHGWRLTCCECGIDDITDDNGQIIDGQVYCDDCAAEISEAGKGGK